MGKKVVIIGAGIGGLATANLLAKAGHQVHVYEKNSSAGGRAGRLQQKGFTFDTGPSWYLMPEVFEQYFSLFDISATEALEITKLSPAYKVFFKESKPLTVTSDITKDSELFESIEPGSGNKLKKYVQKSELVYDLSLKYFLYTNFTSAKDFIKLDIFKNSIRMGLLAFTPIHSYVRRFFKSQKLQQIMEYPMVFLGSSPFKAPAIYNLMSALDFRHGVFYPQGGLYKIIELLLKIGNSNGVSYYYDSPAKQIITKNGNATGMMLESGEIIGADIVISNADLQFTETSLLDINEQTYPKKYWSKRQSGPSAVLMYLGVEGSVPQLEHHNLFFANEWKQNFDYIFNDKQLPKNASLYICKPSATDKTVAPKNHENVFVLVPIPSGLSIDDAKLQAAAESYLAEIEENLSIPDLRKRIVLKELFGPDDFLNSLNSWQGSALGPSHILSQSAIFRSKNKSSKVDNLYYVGGSTVPGIGLPMCLIGAQLVYKRIVGQRRGGPIVSLKDGGT